MSLSESELVVLLMHRYAKFTPRDQRWKTNVIARRIAKKMFHRRKLVNENVRYKKYVEDRSAVPATYGQPVRNLTNYLRGDYK